MKQQLQLWWKTLSRRDQRLFAVWLAGMAIAALVWLWSGLVATEQRAQAHLAAELKVLSTMHAQADELRQLKQLPSVGRQGSGLNMIAVSQSLAKHGLPADIVQTVGDTDQTALQGMVPFDKWVEWIAFAQKDMRLIVQKAKVTRADLPGMVEIQATLELGKD
ncbi:MAG: type II secretion system protein M [Comamonadaceae bacterium]|nr:MAG: type II secretion system protein M [Comamonadaceae bacterium]